MRKILMNGRVDFNPRRDDTTGSSGDHGSKYRVEVIGPGRQDWFSEPRSILFSGAPSSFVAPLISLLSIPFMPTTTSHARQRSAPMLFGSLRELMTPHRRPVR
jgi:hypothetical protein